jgi:hypothetical protein
MITIYTFLYIVGTTRPKNEAPNKNIRHDNCAQAVHQGPGKQEAK